jgi:hypothetical protein
MFAIKSVDLNKVLTNFIFKKGEALRPGVVPRGLLFRRYYLKAVTHLNLVLWLGMRVIIRVVKV